ncbi:MAG: BlaI/MecI/CopY family transcriptional regulator [Oligoflexia bacterium]|nr:BlaI/MecI/CopY family transcriptional regulator [Oligoflexia bacterium]
MKKTKSGSSEKLLTDVELELMNILWSLGEGAVSDVLEKLPAGRELAYTSVSTILRILEQKGVLKARKEGRGHVYVPVLKKPDYEAKAVKHVVEKVFEGTPVALVRQLLNTVDLGPAELEELKSLLSKTGDRK